MNKVMRYFDLELLFWIIALVYLLVINPENSNHFSFCPIKNLGFEFCPGCGLGKGISYFLHFHIKAAFFAHPLSVFATVLIISRIMVLTKNKINFLRSLK